MFQQNIALGPGTESFSSHLVEVIILLLGAAILGFIIGWLFRKTYKAVYLSMKEEHDKCPGIKAGLESNISDLQAALRDSRAELDSAKMSIADLSNKRDTLQASLNDKIKEFENLKGQHEVLGKEASQLSAEHKKLKTLLDQREQAIAGLEAEKARLHQEIKVLKEGPQKPAMKSASTPSPSVPAPPLDFEQAAMILGKKYTLNDLKIVEGIGPKIEQLLHQSGIDTWNKLSKCETFHLKEILASGGDPFQMHDPSTWPQQAHLAAKGLWKELKELQDRLIGGRP